MPVILPSNKKALVKAVKSAADASASIRNESRAVRWAHTYLYLQGCRKFKGINSSQGRIEPVWENGKGGIEMELNTINQQIDTEIGRFDAIDLSPASRQIPGTGLDALRKSSMGQVVFNHILSKESLAETNSVV